MAITPLTLTAALQQMGVAQVFVGSPLVANGMLNLGMTEGDISFEPLYTMNELTAPEWTGAVAHQATVTPGKVILKIPLIMGDPLLWPKITPNAHAGSGYSSPQQVVPTTVLVIPITELGTSLAYSGTAWTPTGTLKNAVWLWKAFPTPGPVGFKYAGGGKVITEVTFTAMFDFTKPEGQKVYSIGDPTIATPNPVTGLII